MEQHSQAQQHQPPQHQDQQPGIESAMTPQPRAEDPTYRGSGKLQHKVALITGGAWLAYRVPCARGDAHDGS